ncbi:hypothetical protein CVT24_001379, partial [Panaeolus cyanescens]
TIKLIPVKRNTNRTKIPRQPLLWGSTLSASAINIQSHYAQLQWFPGKSVVSRAGDICKVGGWVFAQSEELNFQNIGISPISPPRSPSPVSTHTSTASTITGRIVEILQDSRSPCQHSLVAIDLFQVAAIRHEVFGVPILYRPMDKATVVLVNANDILFEYNAQHNCLKAKCTTSGRRNVVLERVEVSQTEVCIEHQAVDEYLINTHALHNAHLLRDCLPHNLVAPIPFRQDRRSYHDEIAARLRGTQLDKREAAANKRAEKAAAAAAATLPASINKPLSESTESSHPHDGVSGSRKRQRTDANIAGELPENAPMDVS